MFLISTEFLSSTHGTLGCINCHEGENLPIKENAHATMIRYPSQNLQGTCYQCHSGVIETFQYSLHYNITGMSNNLLSFSNATTMEQAHGLNEAFNGNCMSCHASCGDCHVSRPKVYTGGLINQHEFFKTPPMDQTCYGCHGARNAGEFMGLVGFNSDVHFDNGMTCMDCHDISNLHGTGEVYNNMWEKPTLPSCLNCHEDQKPGLSELAIHNTHGDSLSCQVCHAQANNNCFECHVSFNEDRTKASGSSESRLMFKIGLNPNPTPERPYKYVTLRHIPTAANSFIEAGENLLPHFDEIANWKYSPTHNIQKNTFQNETCNACHGNERIFLREEDLRESDSEANKKLLPKVPSSM